MHLRAAIVLVLAVVCGCQPSVSRQGYAPGTSARSGTCPVVIQRPGSTSATDVDVVGSIDVGDTGFSMNCARSEVLGIMREEACSVGAHIIEITHERSPDITSTCYRARARFLRLRHTPLPGELANADGFRPALVEARSKSDSSYQWTVIGIAIGAGLAAGLATTAITQAAR